MPTPKPVDSLYKIALTAVHNRFYDYCSFLKDNNEIEISAKLAEKRKDIISILPSWYIHLNYQSSKQNSYCSSVCCYSLLSALLEQHYGYQDRYNVNPHKSYYLYKILVHNNLTHFQAKSHVLRPSYWTSLFEDGFFGNLRSLDLSHSCSDLVLDLISQHCPQLEILNATCRYEQLRYHGNATSFSMPVSDNGLAHLGRCRKLRLLTINEARSCRYGMTSTITHFGIRKLLLEVPTLEDISYSDLGAVIAKDMEHAKTLNLKAVRHYNATTSTLDEIFRLCPRIEKLYLVFFNLENRQPILTQLRQNLNANLKALELNNLNFELDFRPFFEHIGERLEYLTLINNNERFYLKNLVIIGRNCPNLRNLHISRINNQPENTVRPVNFGQFAHLKRLCLNGHDLDLRHVMPFCTENAINLQHIQLGGRMLSEVGDPIFLEWIYPKSVRHIEVSPMVLFSKQAIIEMINMYPALICLIVNCLHDCDDLVNKLAAANMQFTFVNNKREGIL